MSQKSAGSTQFGSAGLGLAPRGLVQSDVVWRRICESKTASYI